jgi:hypothetical protein
MKKRGQFSVEYIMIVAISLLILLPGIYIFRNYAFESNDRMLENRLNEVANSILLRSKKMHYFGPPSKSIVEVEMPPGIGSMFIKNQGNEYYLGFIVLTSSGEKELLYDSNIPIKIASPVACSFTCDICTCFPENTYGEGLKNIKVESAKDTIFHVRINEASAEVAND